MILLIDTTKEKLGKTSLDRLEDIIRTNNFYKKCGYIATGKEHTPDFKLIIYEKKDKNTIMENCKENDSYLASTDCIDYNHPLVQEKVIELREKAESSLDYIKKAYEFVRDEIPHSWDIQLEVVSKKASDVLLNKTGICWTKSCLLAALLRANDIPSGISYQLLTRADEDAREGYIIHALNTVFIDELNTWIRLDARGNKEKVHAQFSIDEECLAFPVREELGEIDYRDNNPDLDERLIKILQNSSNVLEITTDFKMK